MQVFTIDKKKYKTNELKSWLGTVGFSFIMYLILNYFFSIQSENLIVGIVVVFLFKLGDTFTQYHVDTIQIDKINGKLNFKLISLMSGEKIRTYELDQVSSEIVEHKSRSYWFKPSIFLKVYLPAKEIFQITGRYGFAKATLTAVNDVIENYRIS